MPAGPASPSPPRPAEAAAPIIEGSNAPRTEAAAWDSARWGIPPEDVLLVTRPAAESWGGVQVPKPDAAAGGAPHTRVALESLHKPFCRWVRRSYLTHKHGATQPRQDGTAPLVIERQPPRRGEEEGEGGGAAAAAAVAAKTTGTTTHRRAVDVEELPPPMHDVVTELLAMELSATASQPLPEEGEGEWASPVGVLRAYNPEWEWRGGREVSLAGRRPPLPPATFSPTAGRCRPLLVQLCRLELFLGVLEPLHLVVTLYNRTTGLRASESVVLACSPDSMPLPLRCQFRVWDCVTQQLIVVCRVDKVIAASGGVAAHHYGQGRARKQTHNASRLARLSTKAEQWATVFQQYRTPLAVGAWLLSNGDDNETDRSHRLFKWHRSETAISDSLLLRTAEEIMSGTDARKVIGHIVTQSVHPSLPHSADLRQAIHSSTPDEDVVLGEGQRLPFSKGDIIRVLSNHETGLWVGERNGQVGLFLEEWTQPYIAQPLPSTDKLVERLAQSFRTTEVEPRDQHGFLNSLYVYPTLLVMPSSRNFAVRVQLCEATDSAINPIPHDQFFSRQPVSGGNGHRASGQSPDRDDSFLTCVCPASTVCRFTDEARLELPVVLDYERTPYLLFTVLHIQCEGSRRRGGCCSAPVRPRKSSEVETTLGYAVLPLCQKDGLLIEDGKYRLRVSEAISGGDGYTRLSGHSMPEETVPPMTLELRLQNKTCIHSHNPFIMCLISAHARIRQYTLETGVPDEIKVQALAAVQAISAALSSDSTGVEVNHFKELRALTIHEFRLVADALLSFVRLGGSALAYESAQCLQNLLAAMSSDCLRHPTPAFFVGHMMQEQNLHTILCELLATLKCTSQWWFWFDVIIKSLVASGVPHISSNATVPTHKADVDDKFIRDATAIACTVAAAVGGSDGLLHAVDVCRQLGLFAKDLLSCCSKECGLAVVHGFLDAATDPTASNLRWEFLKVVADHEHACALGIPALVTAQVRHAVVAGSKEEAELATSVLVESVSKFCYGAQDRDAIGISTVAASHFDFCLAMLDFWSEADRLNATEEDITSTNCLACFLFVVDTLGAELLTTWLNQENRTRLLGLLRVLTFSIVRFQLSADNCPTHDRVFSIFAQSAVATRALRPDNGHATIEQDQLKGAETRMSSTVTHSVLNTVAALIRTRRKDMKDLIDCTAGVLVCILQRERLTHCALLRTLRCCGDLCEASPESLVMGEECPDLIFSVLSFVCVSGSGPVTRVRRQATLALFRITSACLLGDITERSLYSRLEAYCREAMARLCNFLRDDKDCLISMQMLRMLAETASTSSSLTHSSRVDSSALIADLSTKLTAIVVRSLRLRQTDDRDKSLKAERYMELIHAFKEDVDLKLRWVSNLGDHHAKNQDHAEAGMAYVWQAFTRAQRLERRGHMDSEVVALLRRIIPWHDGSELGSEFTSEQTTIGVDRRHLISSIELAAKNFLQAGLFETSVLAWQVLVRMVDDSASPHQMRKLVMFHGNIRSLYLHAIAAETGNGRIFAAYYRVAFFGAGFGTLAAQAFIYKAPKLTRLSEMCTMLEEQFHTLSPKILSSSQSAEALAQLTGPHIQVTHVVPYSQDTTADTTAYERNVHCRVFEYSTPFTKLGPAQADIKHQWKRKTRVETELSWPCPLLRQRIVSAVSVDLNPPANAIELVQTQARRLRTSAGLEGGSGAQIMPPFVDATDAVNRNQLEQVLTGSVLLQVHGGVLEVAEAFLGGGGGGATTTTDDESERLVESISSFLGSCSDAIAVYRTIAVDADALRLLAELERGGSKLQAQLAQFGVAPRTTPLSGAYEAEEAEPGDARTPSRHEQQPEPVDRAFMASDMAAALARLRALKE